MYDIEVCIPNKVPILTRLKRRARTLEEGREGETLYDKRLIRLSLTGIWDLACGDYNTFLDELVGIILHEYLHYFFHINRIPQNEELIERLALGLQVLSLGHLIGAPDANNEDVEAFEVWLKTWLHARA